MKGFSELMASTTSGAAAEDQLQNPCHVDPATVGTNTKTIYKSSTGELKTRPLIGMKNTWLHSGATPPKLRQSLTIYIYV